MDYLNRLQADYPDVAARYIKKLELINGVDPYGLTDDKFSFTASDFPDVTNMDIVSYLVLSNSFYTKQQMKAFKSLEAFKYFEAGFVSNCCCCIVNNICIVKANVKHSQRMNDQPLKVWILINPDGSVQTAHCTCMAGISEVCSHVAAVLYAVEFVATERKNTSCTDIRAMWKVPQVSKVSYEPIRAMPLGRIIPGSNITEVPPLEGDALLKFFQDIENANSSSALTRVLEPWATSIANSMETCIKIRNPFAELYNDDFLGSELSVLRDFCSNLKITVEPSDCDAVEEATRKQSKCVEWFNQRAGRITASKLKSVCSTNIIKPSLSLIKSICYPQRMTFKSEATEWGLSHEKDGVKKHTEICTPLHRNFTSSNCGLIIYQESPEFAGTPDAIIDCTCCGKGCLEVKCPFLLRKMSIVNYANCTNSCLLINPAGEISLDRKHSYFFQVQMQMAITNSSYCDFLIWSPKEHYLERINYDIEFWQSVRQKAEIFHKAVILPELVGKHFTEANNSATWCFCKGIDDGRPMVKCENDLCSIGWYHLECIGLEVVPDYWFLCSLCQ